MLRQAIVKAKVLYSFVDLVRHPEHLDRVFDMADSLETLAPERLRAMREFFAADANGARALREQPRVGALDLDALGRLPPGTLGRVFADHMRANQLDPKALPLRDAGDELEYIQAHLYETHDIWHAVTGFAADVSGEVGLQAFYLAQFPAGLAAALISMSYLNTLLYAWHERDARTRAIVRGWILGKRSRPFFGVDWKTMWSRPLAEVRQELGVDVAAVDALLPEVAPLRQAA